MYLNLKIFQSCVAKEVGGCQGLGHLLSNAGKSIGGSAIARLGMSCRCSLQ